MRPTAVLAALALSSSTGLFAQSAPTVQDQGRPVPVFRTGVDIVRLDVNVVDSDGRPVVDLRADDIEIIENGESRPVLLFQRVQQPAGTYAEVAQRTIASEVSTNQGSPRGHVYVIVFDQSHITAGNEQRAREAAQRFLRNAIRPGDRLAIYGLPGPGPQVDFTNDVTRAVRALDSVRGGRDDASTTAFGPMRVYEAFEITRGNERMLQQYAEQVLSPVSGADTTLLDRATREAAEDPMVLRRLLLESARAVVARADGESRRFLQQFADVVRSLREIDGRKAVILFSEGFEIDNVRHELESVAAAAAQSYCMVFSLDLNSRFQGLDEMLPRTAALRSEIQSRLDSIGSLASETNGELVSDAGQQLDRALARIAESAQDYYLVGFEPSEAGLKNRDDYRRVRIVVKRPGVRASARSGYAVGPSLAAINPRRAIDAALRAPFSQQNLKIEYTTYVLRGSSSDRQRVVMSLAAELPVATPECAPADVVFAARDVRSGQLAASGKDVIPLPEAPRPGSLVGTGYYRVQFELPPGVYMMRVVVRESGGLLGSADRRFSVRALGGPGVTLGDLVLGSAETSGLPVRASAHRGEALAGAFEIYGRSPSQVDALRVDVDLLPFGTSSATLSARATLDPIRSADGHVSRVARLDLPLGGVPPGEYVVRAIVRAGPEALGELVRDVTILGDRPEPSLLPPVPRAVVDARAVLEGEIARTLVAAIDTRTADSPLSAAASLARRGAWGDVAGSPGLAGSRSRDASILLGLAALAAGQHASAATALGQAFASDSTDAAVAFLLGWSRLAVGNDTGAIGAWRAAVAADPSMVPAYLALIDTYLRLDHPELALQVARAGISLLPNSLELRDRLLNLERRAGSGRGFARSIGWAMKGR
ncbi:MAG: VWA domain-containing protein [Acidobacteriota bacterium]